jgi:hypothetical protein
MLIMYLLVDNYLQWIAGKTAIANSSNISLITLPLYILTYRSVETIGSDGQRDKVINAVSASLKTAI